MCSVDQSARSVDKIFRLHFSVIRMGSRGTFVLCTASSRCTRIAGPSGNETMLVSLELERFCACPCDRFVYFSSKVKIGAAIAGPAVVLRPCNSMQWPATGGDEVYTQSCNIMVLHISYSCNQNKVYVP